MTKLVTAITYLFILGVAVFLTIKATKSDFNSLEVISCFGPHPSINFSNEKLIADIKQNENLILNPHDQNYYNFDRLKKDLYYDVYISNGLQILVDVSSPKYEKIHQAILLDLNDEKFIVNFNETKKVESYVKAEEIKTRQLVISIPVGVLVGPYGTVKLDYHPRNGVACIFVLPKEKILDKLFINYFIKFK